MTTILALATHAALNANAAPVALNDAVFATPRIEIVSLNPCDLIAGPVQATVTVNGVRYQTSATDNVFPRWQIPLDQSERLNRICISLQEANTGNVLDISPLENHRTLCFTYDRQTDQLSGEVSASKGSLLQFTGKGDSHSTEIFFKILDY